MIKQYFIENLVLSELNEAFLTETSDIAEEKVCLFVDKADENFRKCCKFVV